MTNYHRKIENKIIKNSFPSPATESDTFIGVKNVFYQTFTEKIIPGLLKLFQSTAKEEKPPN